jgi:hypothetical protein
LVATISVPPRAKAWSLTEKTNARNSDAVKGRQLIMFLSLSKMIMAILLYIVGSVALKVRWVGVHSAESSHNKDA